MKIKVITYNLRDTYICHTVNDLRMTMLLTTEELDFVAKWYHLETCTQLVIAGYTLIKERN